MCNILNNIICMDPLHFKGYDVLTVGIGLKYI